MSSQDSSNPTQNHNPELRAVLERAFENPNDRVEQAGQVYPKSSWPDDVDRRSDIEAAYRLVEAREAERSAEKQLREDRLGRENHTTSDSELDGRPALAAIDRARQELGPKLYKNMKKKIRDKLINEWLKEEGRLLPLQSGKSLFVSYTSLKRYFKIRPL